MEGPPSSADVGWGEGGTTAPAAPMLVGSPASGDPEDAWMGAPAATARAAALAEALARAASTLAPKARSGPLTLA